MKVTHEIDLETARTLSLNSGHGNKYVRNQAVQQIRAEIGTLIGRNPTPVDTPCVIRVTLFQRTKHRRDPDNVAPIAKPMIDAVVDSGIIPDDNWRHVAWVLYRVEVDPDVVDGTVRVEVEVDGPDFEVAL